ncbi:alpha/beta fold hydrolase [Mycetocola miduiensis]|uniref:Pimeloyl-ACP methyl ester carboxylesterase n=1 Tax=Mycetocola miduiensis TaxID=995034 RepID=A0A1I4YS74_9MICO|nr:alpha/beta hydrolase [Mycetocola miduiensis]SFN40499.1 Pimeloyl-ACP methyl ester carboxylesterase [Mycetocola miduiensis]
MSVKTQRGKQDPLAIRPGEPATRPRHRHRWGRVLGVVALAVLALVLTGVVTNAVLEQTERRTVAAYGERVAVTGGDVNVYRHGDSGPTIVMLTGYGTAAPALDFAPLIRELDGYQVVVVEGFGYGYSDTTAPPRTVENISSELHEALASVDVDQPYVLLGHSIAGIYDLYYANQYSDEVAAVIGIDASVPGQINGLAGQGNPLPRLVSATGLLRLATALAPSLAEPQSTAYTARELEQIRMLTNWNWANPAILDEANQGERNLSVVEDMTYPHDIPVLSFIKKEGSQAGWRELHEKQLENQDRGELVELDGGHYLHWTQAEELARRIDQFLSDAALNG